MVVRFRQWFPLTHLISFIAELLVRQRLRQVSSRQRAGGEGRWRGLGEKMEKASPRSYLGHPPTKVNAPPRNVADSCEQKALRLTSLVSVTRLVELLVGHGMRQVHIRRNQNQVLISKTNVKNKRCRSFRT